MKLFTAIALLLYLPLISGSGLQTNSNDLDSWLYNFSTQRVCYDNFGCFDLSGPWFSWTRPVPVLPQHPDVIDTKFYLVTRKNMNSPEQLQTKPEISVSEKAIDRRKWTIFVIHGYIGHFTNEWIKILCKELLTLYDVNIILVDWANGANNANYIQAVADTRLVGAEVSRLVRFLQQKGTVSPERIHCVGYSLGAQVASYVGHNIKSLYRITGLEPAQPGFEGTDPLVRLDKSDAKFVDVMHTNGIQFLPNLGFGMRESVGHSDFFVNGGEIQPSCEWSVWTEKAPVRKRQVYEHIQYYLENQSKLNIRVESLIDIEMLLNNSNYSNGRINSTRTSFNLLEFLMGKIYYLSDFISCSHNKAQEYILESLQSENCTFWGLSWTPYENPAPKTNCSIQLCNEMGFNSIRYPARGNFYVPTNIRPPYCVGSPDFDHIMDSGRTQQDLYPIQN